jgi:hypothetical protein
VALEISEFCLQEKHLAGLGKLKVKPVKPIEPVRGVGNGQTRVPRFLRI